LAQPVYFKEMLLLKAQLSNYVKNSLRTYVIMNTDTVST